VKLRIATALAVPLAVMALLAAGPGTASASPGSGTATAGRLTLIAHMTGQVHLPGPGSSDGVRTDAATASGQTCYWDAYIFRADNIGSIMGQTAVLCDGPMVQIQVDARLLINGNYRIGSNAHGATPPGDPSASITTPRMACLPGANRAYGVVFVMNEFGSASDWGESLSTITC
jgi:hypothetical protein